MTPTERDGQRASQRASARADKRGRWPRALASLFGAIAMILAIRWAFFEPYVIPSGSMIPTLLINDHILVNKLAYGVRVPFSTHWLVHFGNPKRGDVVVFRSVDDESIFLVKRVIGIAGDEIRLQEDGTLLVNGEKVLRSRLSESQLLERFAFWPPDVASELFQSNEIYDESFDAGASSHTTLWSKDRAHSPQGPYRVPAESLFMMGDNRDNSSDSRVWGVLPVNRVLGRASYIWLACEETLADSGQLCDPKTIRLDRMFHSIW